MTCREFAKQTEGLTLAEIARSAGQELFGHERECASCASWLQQQRSLAGALQTLHSETATLQAGASVEHAVLRAFRQTLPSAPAKEMHRHALALRWSRYFGWAAYAAAAAALAVAFGLGAWFWQHSENIAKESARQRPAVEQPTTSVQETQTAGTQQSPSASEASRVAQVHHSRPEGVSRAVTSRQSPNSSQSLAQVVQTQGYVPLMLCDPLSCSGDEQVVRMELPASAVDASRDSSEPLVADVVLGEDGLVRAIRIVQQ
jgi:hypothetical protein